MAGPCKESAPSMLPSKITASHACHLLAQITLEDDGIHQSELIELIEGITDPDNEVAQQCWQFLREMGSCSCLAPALDPCNQHLDVAVNK